MYTFIFPMKPIIWGPHCHVQGDSLRMHVYMSFVCFTAFRVLVAATRQYLLCMGLSLIVCSIAVNSRWGSIRCKQCCEIFIIEAPSFVTQVSLKHWYTNIHVSATIRLCTNEFDSKQMRYIYICNIFQMLVKHLLFYFHYITGEMRR